MDAPDQPSRRDALKALGAVWIGASLEHLGAGSPGKVPGSGRSPGATFGTGRAGGAPHARRMAETLISGGRVVNADGARDLDVRIVDEQIVEVGVGLQAGPEASRIDATGKLVIPGGIDPHTHLQGGFADDYTSGSRAAIAGGVTTVGTFASTRRDEDVGDALERLRGEVESQAIADVFFHFRGWPPTPAFAAQMPTLAAQGQPSIKIYMVRRDFGERIPEMIRLLEAARDAGVVTMIHCEDQNIIDAASRRLAAEGRTSLAYYGESRPVLSESAATEQAVALCEATGAPMQVVHLSSARALEACRRGRERGLPLYVEIRPMYLHLTEERMAGPDGPLFVGQPPLRTRRDADALWEGLSSGAADLLATDHAPWTRAQKMDPELSITNFRPGVSALRFMLPLYFSEGVVTGRLSVERFVETTSTATARIMGLYPRKGVIQEGSDADLVVFDPNRTDTVRATDDPSNSDYTLYEGWSVTGWPETTIRRGEVVFERGQVVGRPGSGRLAERTPWR